MCKINDGGENDMTGYKKERSRIKMGYPQAHRFETFLKSAIKGRKLLIWGASPKSDWFYSLCVSAELEVTAYIDNDPDILHYNDRPVFQPNILIPSEHFVFVALENRYPEVFLQMEGCSMKEFEDYIYPSGNTVILTGCEREYFDLNGNEVSGVIDGYHVGLSKGSKLVIGKNCRIDKSTQIQLSQNAVLVIGNGCVIDQQCYISVSDSLCMIGNNCFIGDSSRILLRSASNVFMGDDSTYGPYFKLGASRSATCKIEKDCMFSTDVRLQCADGHNYFDLKDKINIGMKKQNVVHVGEHVWVGAKSNLLYGTDIGPGSIVGMGSFVNKRFPANTVIAGNPARIVREHVAWVRGGEDFIQDSAVFEPYDFSAPEAKTWMKEEV